MNWYKEANIRNVKLKGTLKQNNKGFVYLDISNDVIHGLFTLINEDNIEKPPYFDKDGIGAHVSVISNEEIEDDLIIEELGKDFLFEIDTIKSVEPKTWKEMERVWFVELKASSLEKLREKYKLPATYKNLKHKFHITIAVRRKK